MGMFIVWAEEGDPAVLLVLLVLLIQGQLMMHDLELCSSFLRIGRNNNLLQK